MDTSNREEPKEIPILYKFSEEEFISRHLQGVAADFELEKWTINRFNKSKTSFAAWPIMTVSSHRWDDTWLFLVKLRKIEIPLPNEGEICRFRLWTTYDVDDASNEWWTARRIATPYSRLGSGTDWDRFGAFQVRVPRRMALQSAWKSDAKSQSGGKLTLSRETCRRLILNLRVSDTTVNFEKEALRKMSDASAGEKVDMIFAFWTSFDTPGFSCNLFAHLPHLADFQNVPQPLRGKLMQKYQSLDSHQKIAYDNLLGDIPCGICIVPGGPGAGKTSWNLFVAAAAQSSDSIVGQSGQEMTTRRVKVLYILDINKPLGDIASRMIRLYSELGMQKNAIRMYYWRYSMLEIDPSIIRRQKREVECAIAKIEAGNSDEVITSDKGDGQDSEGPDERLRVMDFSAAFLEVGYNKQRPPKERIKTRGDCLAMTLDEAAWDNYEANKDGKYRHLAYMMPKALRDDKTNEYFKYLVWRIYQEVLEATDFIATTPVAASKYLTNKWNPELVFFDEAPHAREASNLMAVANFNPLAFFFTGDPKQTQPFVRYPGRTDDPKSPPPKNYWRSQLKVSMMERAEKLGAVFHSLLINHRAHANLHKLASSLFYDGRMETAMSGDSLYPPSTKHLMQWISGMLSVPCKVPRIRVSMNGKDHDVEEVGTSFQNTRHLQWVMGRVAELVVDPNFTQPHVSLRGTILIITPYKEAFHAYQDAIRRLNVSLDRKHGRQGIHSTCSVEARTIDTAQGHEADVVFFDLVKRKVSQFLDDAHRLNVAISRARQAEFVLIDDIMMTRDPHAFEETEHIKKLFLEIEHVLHCK